MDTIAKAIIGADDDSSEEAVDKFLQNASTNFQFPEFNDSGIRKDLWDALYRISNSTENNELIYKCFSAVRILSRDKTSLSQMVTEDWLNLLKKHAKLNEDNFEFTDANLKVALEAEKCLCNIVFNSLQAASKCCCKTGILNAVVLRIKKFKDIPYEDIKFFDAKLLFIISAVRPEVRRDIKNKLNGVIYLMEALEEILNETISKTEFQNGDLPKICLSDMQVNITCEILKALFNITLHVNEKDVEEVQCFTNLVVILRKYLLVPTGDPEKRCMLQNDVINLLTNMPSQSYSSLMVPVTEEDHLPSSLVFDDMNLTAIYEILLLLKDKVNKEPTVSKQHGVLSPVITVLLKMTTSNKTIRKYLKSQILPPLKDVHSRPEQGDELRNHLCRLLTTPITELRDIVAEFLFILCKKNVTRMIKYTGYGNAAGLFAQRGLLGGRKDEGEADFSSDDGDSETEEYAEMKHGINPVVGCYEKPHPNPMDNMSDEQKEYEAIRLVQLIDSLTKCGAVRPCRVGRDGKPEPIEHVLQLQEGIKAQSNKNDDDSD